MLNKRSVYIIILIIVNIVIDQVSKFWIRAHIEPNHQSELIGTYFQLNNVENKGAFLGMGSELNSATKIFLLWLLPIIGLALVLRYTFKNKSLDNLSLTGFACIIGGGIANIYDRIALGSVTDFFFIDLGGVFKTGIFNMADISVTMGIFIIIVASFLYKRKSNILNT